MYVDSALLPENLTLTFSPGEIESSYFLSSSHYIYIITQTRTVYMEYYPIHAVSRARFFINKKKDNLDLYGDVGVGGGRV